MPDHDQFTSIADTELSIATWTNTTLTVLAGADHFMAGQFGTTKDSVLDELVSQAIASVS